MAIAPKMAPGIVAVSKSNPNLIFVILVFKYALAAVQELATIATKLLPMAICIGNFSTKVRIGTIIKPPPTPSIDPKMPAVNPAANSEQRLVIVSSIERNGSISFNIGSIYTLILFGLENIVLTFVR